MDLMDSHDLADIRPNIGLGNALCGNTICKNAII